MIKEYAYWHKVQRGSNSHVEEKIFTYEKNIVMDNLVSADLRISMDNID
jgi:hypothetical protein